MNEEREMLFPDVPPHEMAAVLAVRDPAFGLQSMDLLMRTRFAELHDSMAANDETVDDAVLAHRSAGMVAPMPILPMSRDGAQENWLAVDK